MVCPQDAQEETDFEIGWRKAGSPLYIELHRSLFEPGSDALGAFSSLFDGALERAEPYEADGMTLRSCRRRSICSICCCTPTSTSSTAGSASARSATWGFGRGTTPRASILVRLREQLERVYAAKFAAAVLAIAESELGIPIPGRWEKGHRL